MTPVVKKEDLQRIVDQINSRFEWFTNKVNELEHRIKELEDSKQPKPTTKK